MRNRIASEMMEEQWDVNYRVNKKYLGRPNYVPVETLYNDQENSVALVVGAGPKLDDNLRSAACLDRCSIFCTDKAFPMLSKHAIVPKFVMALNAKSPDHEVNTWWASCDTSQSTLVMPITADPLTLKNWAGSYCFVNCDLPIELTERITTETGLRAVPGGTNVGVFSYLMAARLGYKKLVLIGMDYSFESREQVVKRYRADEPYVIFEHRDAKGDIRWSSWDWFDSAISFFEYARFFSRNGVRTINSTDGGILYDGEYVEQRTLQEALLESP